MRTPPLDEPPRWVRFLDPARYVAPVAQPAAPLADLPILQPSPTARTAGKGRAIAAPPPPLTRPAKPLSLPAVVRWLWPAEPTAASSSRQQRPSRSPALPYELIERIFADPAARLTPRKLRALATNQQGTFFNFDFNENVLKSNAVWAAWGPTGGASFRGVGKAAEHIWGWKGLPVVAIPSWTDLAADETPFYALWVKQWRATDESSRSDLESLYKLIETDRLLPAEQWCNNITKREKHQTEWDYHEQEHIRRVYDYNITLARLRAIKPVTKWPKKTANALSFENAEVCHMARRQRFSDFNIARAVLAHTSNASYLLTLDLYREPRAMSQLWLDMIERDAARALFYLAHDISYVLRRRFELKQETERALARTTCAGQLDQIRSSEPTDALSEQGRLDLMLDERFGLLRALAPVANAERDQRAASLAQGEAGTSKSDLQRRFEHWSGFDVAALLNRADALYQNAAVVLSSELRQRLERDQELYEKLAEGVRASLALGPAAQVNVHPAFQTNWQWQDRVPVRPMGTMTNWQVKGVGRDEQFIWL